MTVFEIIFELGINLIETLIMLDFITRYLGCKYNDQRKIIGFISAWLVLFLELCLINYVLPFEGIIAFIPIVVRFIYALMFLNGSVLLKLWISALTEIILMIVAVGSNLGICYIIGYNPNDMITVFNITRIISVIIVHIIIFYATRVILRYRYKNPIDKQSWFLLILIPTISLISLSALMLAAMDYEAIKGYILVGMASIVIANIITYYFFEQLNKRYETNLKMKLLEQNNENALRNIEQANAYVEQMKAVRHDMNNQLAIIHNLASAGKTEEMMSYIDTLTNNYLPDIQSYIHTDNDAFDAIMNSKIAVCNQKHIFIEVKEKKNSLDGLNAVDTGILFGNLLDNAVEAADKTENRRITVDIQTQGEYLSILVTNSISASVLGNNSELETSKKDKDLHGIGIKNIRALVSKYDGMIQFYEEANEFCCHILLDKNKISETR